MKIAKTKGRDEILDFITQAATAVTESDAVKGAMAGIEAMMNPVDSREEMGTIFQENLGWNPIRDYDTMDFGAIVDDVVKSGNDVIARLVTTSRERLIDRAMSIYEASREEHMQLCLVKAANELFGYSDAEAIADIIGCDIAEVVDTTRPVPAEDDEGELEGFEDPLGDTGSHSDPDDDLLFGGDNDDDEE